MLTTACSFTLDGVVARPVRVEVEVHSGLPAFNIVGLPEIAVHESRERIQSALVNSCFEFPQQRIVANLAPANLRKSGPDLDLAIAVALLGASAQLPSELDDLVFVGELALDGTTRSVAGVLPFAEAARETGAARIVVPAENSAEAALVAGLEVVPLERLGELPARIRQKRRSLTPAPLALPDVPPPTSPDLADLRGQPQLRRALELAAAGGHSLLLVGPRGAGKSLAASRLPSILPPLSQDEALEVARIASACGRLDTLGGGRPFRAPHHAISGAALFGGGRPLRAGEVTLAHRGVLLLAEITDLPRDTFDALRTSMEVGEVTIPRGRANRKLPSAFTLVAASDSCPCGHGYRRSDCICPPDSLEQFRIRLEDLADCFDIVVAVEPPAAAEIAGPPSEASAVVRQRVVAARDRAMARLGQGRTNAGMTSSESKKLLLSAEASYLLAAFHPRTELSTHIQNRVLRLARTIADMAEEETIGAEEVAEALQLHDLD